MLLSVEPGVDSSSSNNTPDQRQSHLLQHQHTTAARGAEAGGAALLHLQKHPSSDPDHQQSIVRRPSQKKHRPSFTANAMTSAAASGGGAAPRVFDSQSSSSSGSSSHFTTSEGTDASHRNSGSSNSSSSSSSISSANNNFPSDSSKNSSTTTPSKMSRRGGPGLSLAGSMPAQSPSTTPFNHPAAFPWATGAQGPSVTGNSTASLATSILMSSTSEAPDYFAQHMADSPAAATSSIATKDFGASSFGQQQQQQHQQDRSNPFESSPSTDRKHALDPFSHLQPSTTSSAGPTSSSTSSPSFFIPSGAITGASVAAGSRFSIPPNLSRLPPGFSNFGGVPMSARSSRQSIASSSHSIAASTNSGASFGTSNSANSGLADDLLRFRPVEPDVLASLLATSASEDSIQPDNAHDKSGSSSVSTASLSSQTDLSGSASDKVLIIDIRSSASYSSARIRSSINVCAPSTLLKRPGITVDQVEEEMLGSEVDRRRFKRWREGPRRIRQRATQHAAESPIASLSRSNSRSKKASTGSSTHSSPQKNAGASRAVPASPSAAAAVSASNSAGSMIPSSPPASAQGESGGATTLVPASANGVTKIIVLDNDTARVADGGKPATGGGASCLVGMLRKFEAAGFAGELGWLVGGFARFAGCKGAKEAGLIDRAPFAAGGGGGEDGAAQSGGGVQQSLTGNGTAASMHLDIRNSDLSNRRGSAPNPGPHGAAAGDAKHKDAQGNNAEAATSKPSQNRRHFLVQPRGLPLSAFSISTTTSNPGSSNLGDRGLVGGLRARESASACANPFFDNIRQNRELAHGVTERVPLELPSLSSAQKAALPGFLQRLASTSETQRAEELAQGFFSIEKAEQRRLMGTMQSHAAESGSDPRATMGRTVAAAGEANSPSPTGPQRKPHQLLSSLAVIDGAPPAPRSPASDSSTTTTEKQPGSPFPFSIAAALERGAENRYDNIWTYEHSRVRLAHQRNLTDPNSNYINASFLQPAREFGCGRTYIATQAPLPSTFEHFWMMCWEQNVRVIVMVTREHEAGRIQAHRYWDASCYGRDVRLRQISERCFDSRGNEVDDAEAANRLGRNANDEAGGGMFPTMPAATTGPSDKPRPVLIRRTFTLANAAEPEAGERQITQLQYVAWPDYTVPESPESLLRLLDVADAAQFEAEQELGESAKPLSGNLFAHSFGAGVSKASSKRPVGPMVVHCSAGVGRTGTFVAVDSALDAIRRQRAGAMKIQALRGVWHNGKASLVQSSSNAATKTDVASAPEVDMSTTTERKPSYTLQASPFQAQAGQAPPLSPSRPALKREHSMELDDRTAFALKAESNPFNFDTASYRPRARTRSIEPSGSDGEHEHAFLPTTTSSSTSASSPEHTPGYHVPSPLPTPLRHLDSMCLTAAPSSSSVEASIASDAPPSQDDSPMDLVPPQPASPSERAAANRASLSSSSKMAGTSPLTASTATVTTNSSGTGATAQAQAKHDSADFVRRIVEVMREQRMSSVQTTRQYVFVYSTVLAGVLRDLALEGIK